METDTTTSRTEMPDAWPPLTPVELTRVSQTLARVFICGTLAVVLAVACATWLIHRDNVAILQALTERSR